jgi:hypothetical protein
MTTTIRNESLIGTSISVEQTHSNTIEQQALSLKAILFTKEHTIKNEQLIPLIPTNSSVISSITLRQYVYVSVFLILLVAYLLPMDVNAFLVYMMSFLLHE